MLSVDHQARLRQPGSGSAITWAPDLSDFNTFWISFWFLFGFLPENFHTSSCFRLRQAGLALGSATTWTPDGAGPRLTLIFLDFFLICSGFLPKTYHISSWKFWIASAGLVPVQQPGPQTGLAHVWAYSGDLTSSFHLGQAFTLHREGLEIHWVGKVHDIQFSTPFTLRMSNSECKDVFGHG